MSPDTTQRNHQIELALPRQWTVHAAGDWARLAELPAVNPVLRIAARTLPIAGAQPDVVASLFHEIRVGEDDSFVVVMASLVVFSFDLEPGAHQAVLGGRVRRDVSLIDGLRADFFEYTVFVTDEPKGLCALATFTTPNLPLIADMEVGFRAIADSITFVSVDLPAPS